VRHKFIFIVNKGSSLGGFLPRQAFIKNNTTQNHKSINQGLGEYAKYIKQSHRYFE
jgi:hypothetical protein